MKNRVFALLAALFLLTAAAAAGCSPVTSYEARASVKNYQFSEKIQNVEIETSAFDIRIAHTDGTRADIVCRTGNGKCPEVHLPVHRRWHVSSPAYDRRRVLATSW